MTDESTEPKPAAAEAAEAAEAEANDEAIDDAEPEADGEGDGDAAAAPDVAAATDAPKKKKKKPPKSRRPQWILFAIVALLSLAADEGTKIWARSSLPTQYVQGHGIPSATTCIVPDDIVEGICRGKDVPVIDGAWDWQLSMNPGSAFGLFSSQTGARVFLSIVGIAAVAGMLWMLKKARPDQKILHWALALVAGGAVGNLIDRIYFGVVTDFVSWHYGEHRWPTFNVADVVLVAGVILMFFDIQKEGKREKRKRAKRQAKAQAAGLVVELKS